MFCFSRKLPTSPQKKKNAALVRGSDPVEAQDLGDLLNRRKDDWYIATVAVEVPATGESSEVKVPTTGVGAVVATRRNE